MLLTPAVFAGSGASYGSWQVVGNAGALAVHAIPFTNDLILFMSRPNNRNGSGDDPYLTVKTVRRLMSYRVIDALHLFQGNLNNTRGRH